MQKFENIHKMRIIHTSDWHLGQVFNEYDRTQEHVAFFRRLAGIVEKECPDALLVSGDIYHNSIPSAQTQKMYTDSLLMLKRACPGMTVVVTAGNHDSGARLEVDMNLWDHLGVKVIGGLARNGRVFDPEKHIIGIPSKEGGIAGYVVALPYVYRQNYPAAGQEQEGEHSLPDGERYFSRQASFYRRLLDSVREKNIQGLPVVMMAHLAVTGYDLSGHDIPVGGIEFTPLSAFPQGYDYLALGHIHRPQTVGTAKGPGDAGVSTGMVPGEPVLEHVCPAPVARYSGSPLHVNFDEDYPHSVSVVDIPADPSEREYIRIREIEIPETVPMVTLPETPVPSEDAIAALLAYPDQKPAYIRLNVLVRDCLRQNVAVDAVKATEGKKCRYCYMKVTRESQAGTEDTRQHLTVAEMKTISPLEVARMYYRQQFSGELDRESETMLQEVTGELQD